MTQINIGGKVVEVGDDFLKLSPEDQGKTVDEIAAQIGTQNLDHPHSTVPNEVAQKAVGLNDVVRSGAEGVPIVGGALNKLDALTNAAISPVAEQFMKRSPEDISVDEKGVPNADFWQRYRRSLDIQNKKSAEMAAQHPVVDTAAKLATGTAAMAPLAASGVAARALGMSGTLPQMVTRGAISNAAMGAADEAVRGGDPLTGAEVGAVSGAGLPVAGRLIGKAVNAVRPSGPLPPLPTTDVNGVPVPQFRSSQTGDNALGSQEQMSLSGALGEKPQKIAQSAFDARQAAVEQAREKMGADLSAQTSPDLGAPPGAPQATPHAAGDQIITELAQQHNDQVQQNALRGVGVQASDALTRQNVAGPQLDAHAAAEGMGGAVQQAARTAATARTGAYQAAGETPGTFNPAAFERISNSIQQRLNSGPPENRVRINDRTPLARDALNLIEEQIGSGRVPANDVSPRVSNYNDLLNSGTPTRPIPPITGRDVESVRQQLVPLMRDANAKARGPSPDATDARAMRRVMDAFDQHVRDSVQAGAFSGDGQQLLGRYDAARAAHANYRGMFSARGQGDTVGPIVEKIIGKHPGQEMTPDAIANAMYGSPAAPGGGNTVQVAQRLQNIVGGPASPQWQAAKQGLLSHILDTPAGTADRAPAEQAERLRNLFTSTKSRTLAQVFFSPQDREALMRHADLLESLVPNRGPLGPVDRQVMRLSGADGHAPASSRDAVDMLMSGDGTKASSVALAQRLKDTLSPESFDALRQGMWTHLTTKPEGMIEFGPQAISQRLHKFLSEPMASTLYSSRELQLMKVLADEYKKMIPLPNTTNPSGSGVTGAKVIRLAQGNLLPMLGFIAHGPVGIAAGAAANKALKFVGDRRAVQRTKQLFSGDAAQPSSGPNLERAAAILSHAATPLIGTTGQ
jgi:hypothetical protein